MNISKKPSGISMISNKQIVLEESFESILSCAIKMHFYKGDIVVDIDEIVQYLYFLKEGCLTLYIPSYDNEVIMHNIIPPITFCEGIFFKQKPSKARVIATLDSIVLGVPKNIVFNYMKKQDEFVQFLINNLCTKLIVNASRLESISNADSKVKIAKLIYILTNNSNSVSDDIYITHNELAQILGIHRVTVSRNLAKLQEEEVIKTFRNHIKIINLEKLMMYIT